MGTILPLRYTGLFADPISAGYPLGSGYRLYLPSLMRFAAADGSSPFDKGGINPYGYCEAEPVARRDPSGHFFLPVGLAIGAISVITLKAVGSMLVRKYRGPVKAWIDALNDNGNIGAYRAAESAGSTFSEEHLATGSASESGQPSWFREEPVGSGRNGSGTARQHTRQAKASPGTGAEIGERLTHAQTHLGVARKHWESARLLHRGAQSSSEPISVAQLASEETEAGLARLDTIGRLVDDINGVRNTLKFKLTVRFDAVEAEYEALRFDFDDMRSPADWSTHL